MHELNPELPHSTLQKNASESSDPIVHQFAEILTEDAIILGTRFEFPKAPEHLQSVADAIDLDKNVLNKDKEILAIIVSNPHSNSHGVRGRYVEFFNEIGPSAALPLLQADEWNHPNLYQNLGSYISSGTIAAERDEKGEKMIELTEPIITVTINALYSAARRKELELFYETLVPYGEQDNHQYTRAGDLELPAKALWRYIQDTQNIPPTIPINNASIAIGSTEKGPWYSAYTGARTRQTYRLNKSGKLVRKSDY